METQPENGSLPRPEGGRKKMWLIGLAVLFLAALVALAAYNYAQSHNSPKPDTNPAKTQALSPQTTVPDNKMPASQDSGIQVEAKGSGAGSLIVTLKSVCFNKCGDGICQAQDLACKPGDPNCICPETKTECPQDCK